MKNKNETSNISSKKYYSRLSLQLVFVQVLLEGGDFESGVHLFGKLADNDGWIRYVWVLALSEEMLWDVRLEVNIIPANRMSRAPAANRKRVSKMQVISVRKKGMT